MLKHILEAFRNTPGPMTLDLLAAQLDVDSDVLEGMLAELVRMKRLERLEDRSAASCTACGIKERCPYLLTMTGIAYALPDSETLAGGEPCRS